MSSTQFPATQRPDQPQQQPANPAPSQQPSQSQPPQQPSQPPARQQALDAQTQQYNKTQSDASAQEAKKREDGIKAAAEQQRTKQKQKDVQIVQGDYVVIDLERVPQELHTVPMRESLRGLHQAGGHQIAGRVQEIQDGPTGRQFVIETANRNYTVPAAAVVRADLYMDED